MKKIILALSLTLAASFAAANPYIDSYTAWMNNAERCIGKVTPLLIAMDKKTSPAAMLPVLNKINQALHAGACTNYLDGARDAKYAYSQVPYSMKNATANRAYELATGFVPVFRNLKTKSSNILRGAGYI